MSPSPSTGSRESRSQAPPPSGQPASHRLLRSQTQNDRSPVTARHLFLDLKSRIISARGPGDIRVKDIPPEIGLLVARSLRDDAEVEGRCHRISYNPVTCYFEIVMPSPTHEALAGWIRIEFEDARVTRFFTRPESLTIIYQPSPSIDSFTGRWANAYKEPDSALMYLNSSMPSVVFETGLTESYPRLLSHKDLWLLGGAPNVNVVLLLKLNKRSNNRVAAFLELHRAGAAAPTRVDVFPAPPPFTPTQYVTFYRKDFYPGGRVPPDRNANDAWNWNVDSFRWLLTNVMSSEGLVPA